MHYAMSQKGLGSRIVPKGVSLHADCMGFVRIIGEISVYRAFGAGTAQPLRKTIIENKKRALGNHREPLREPVPEWFPHRSQWVPVIFVPRRNPPYRGAAWARYFSKQRET